jgi:hypothetical protein
MNIDERDSEGLCTWCRQHIKHGPNLNCPQCCRERREGTLSYDQKVEAVVERLRRQGGRVNVRRRKLADRTKTYLRIRAGGTLNTFKSLVMPLVRKDFPEAYMTSGAFTPEPWASDPHMDITVSLDPRSD